ncbi:hypothetical protein E5CHR_04240 [Variovorax sp. PBL-E5]|nr:hypothetical protein E5CHR_04240 [Variovorax sp. PBL-E5]
MLMGTVTPDDISKSRACAEEKIQGAKIGYQALPTQSKPAATTALKDYFAAWIGAMKSVPGLLAGSKRDKDSASQATKQRLEELWAHVEIEAGI